MATAPSRSPLHARVHVHVCGGRLHAFEKLFVARCPSIHRWERYEKYMNLSCPLAQRFTWGVLNRVGLPVQNPPMGDEAED